MMDEIFHSKPKKGLISRFDYCYRTICGVTQLLFPLVGIEKKTSRELCCEPPSAANKVSGAGRQSTVVAATAFEAPVSGENFLSRKAVWCFCPNQYQQNEMLFKKHSIWLFDKEYVSTCQHIAFFYSLKGHVRSMEKLIIYKQHIYNNFVALHKNIF